MTVSLWLGVAHPVTLSSRVLKPSKDGHFTAWNLKILSMQFLADVRVICWTLFSRLNKNRYCCLWASHVPLAAAGPHSPSPHDFLCWTEYWSLWNFTGSGKRMIAYFDLVAVLFNVQYFNFLVKIHPVAHIPPWRLLQSPNLFSVAITLSDSCHPVQMLRITLSHV